MTVIHLRRHVPQVHGDLPRFRCEIRSDTLQPLAGLMGDLGEVHLHAQETVLTISCEEPLTTLLGLLIRELAERETDRGEPKQPSVHELIHSWLVDTDKLLVVLDRKGGSRGSRVPLGLVPIIIRVLRLLLLHGQLRGDFLALEDFITPLMQRGIKFLRVRSPTKHALQASFRTGYLLSGSRVR